MNIANEFEKKFGEKPQFIVRAPGRINLIGEHTDYNDGFVLPAAIDRAMYFALSQRSDNWANIFSSHFGEFLEFDVNNISKNQSSWSHYLKGIIQQFQRRNCDIGGFNLVFGGDIPLGAGVSSSAALGAGFAFGLNELFGLHFDRVELAKISQQSENQFIGLNCGIMDMFASLHGKQDAVLLLDCRSLDFQYFSFLQTDCALVLCDTGVKHNLGDSEYNLRRAECERGVAALQTYYPDIQSLRDVSMPQLARCESAMEAVTYKRCRYVVQEIERTQSACKDLINNDLRTFGKKMYATHDGLRDDYEVSCPELDFLVSNTQTMPAETVLGARLMGGGFGGCTINLVAKNQIDVFIAEQTKSYKSKFSLHLACHKVVITDGVSIISGNK